METTIGWVATAAFVVGLLVRLSKEDALGKALASLGLPPIPKRALPWIAFVLGLASAVLDHRLQGTPWVEAVTKGFLAAVTAMAGHDLGKSVPGVKKVLGVALLVAFGWSASACSFFQAHGTALLDKVLRDTKCMVDRSHLPFDRAAVECFLTAEEAERTRPTFVSAQAKVVSARAEATCDAGAP